MTLFTSITVPLVYTLTLISATFWPVMPTIYWLMPISLISFALLIKRRFILLTGFIALSVALIQGNLLKSQTEALFRFGTDITIKARVDSYFKQISQGYEADVTVFSVNGEPINLVYKPKIKLKLSMPVDVGSWVVAPVRLKRVIGVKNRVGFDKEKYYFAHGLLAQARVHDSAHTMVLSKRHWKSFIYDGIYRATSTSRYQGYYLALIFGDRSKLTSVDWTNLRESGLSHLMAISGLHVAIVFSIGVFAGRAVVLLSALLSRQIRHSTGKKRWFAQIAMFIASQPWLSVLSGFVFAGFYGALAHFPIPTVRALLMLLILYLIYSRSIKADAAAMLLLSAGLILTVLPFSSASMSFWLSYYAVGALVVLAAYLRQPQYVDAGKIRTGLFFHIGLAVLFLPLLIIVFNGASMGSALYNLIFVPWFSIIVMPALLVTTVFSVVASMMGLDEFGLYSMVMDPLLSVVIKAMSYSSWFWVELEPHYVLPILFVIAAVFFWQWMMVRWVSIIALVALFLWIEAEKNHHFRVVVLDVGHGLAVIIQQGDEAVIYDTGMEVAGFSIAQRLITPTLAQLGVNSLEGIILSHADNDHAGGAAYLQHQWQPLWVRKSDANVTELPCIAGEQWRWNEVTFEALWPPELVSRAYNPHSCVVLMTYSPKEQSHKHQLLLTGDIDQISEILLARHLPLLDLDAMLVPHHGSKTSSSKWLLNRIRTKHAIASTRFAGRWNLPNPDVKARYLNNGAKWYDTGSSGQVNLSFSAQEVSAFTLRGDKLAPWYRQMLRSGVE
ncbi:DNA internalization-related competence protein ComEC/Rec2 [Vibrio methylphosphonaticus]|uniref:DNA internalization-related competence protein ComEC/Rec2 n=1 Tax=Vibrio methylphosphonaticus TaxID=2946866 RepID=UPI00202A01D1|nr:DNA internalization-related competence protein ComEC/Rec2 [Vibrio methylphosphonaticus]MCL9774672.1 DNA internalization-related competence protein ComEC/Rec2 [Vibrio methylphosphonaticus]